ncbi:MAG TPA: cytochrome b5-like heme/steroid binding domain-containing protein [Aquiluna sp.]
MRPIVLASALLLVLSGCAAAQPESQPVATAQTQSTQTTEPTQTTEATETAESAETAQATETDATSDPEPEQSETEVQAERSEESETEPESGSEPTTTPQATQTATESESTETTTETATPTPTPTEEPAPEPEVVGYTLAQVAQKNSAAECWVAIDGNVYDLTQWIRSHPGGQGAITQLCGTDGTAQFLGMHGGQSRPSSTLDGYLIGPLR